MSFKKLLTMKSIKWSMLLICQSVCIGSYSVLVHLCEKDGQISFNSTVMNFIVELIKLLISFIGLLIYKHQNKTITTDDINVEFSFKNSLYFSIPAALYFINNNLSVLLQLFMDPTTYQMLCNLKIFTTAILYYFIMG
jgi:solute carrier family 35 (probable UDP-sugar transporter), member A4